MYGGGGGRGNFLSALKKFSARKGVTNYKEKWKIVAKKDERSNMIDCPSFIPDLLTGH